MSNQTGKFLVTTSRDRKLCLFDPRMSGEAVRVAEGHGGIKARASSGWATAIVWRRRDSAG
jgi:hypothetical protein